MVCNGDGVRGVAAPTIETVTATVQKLLDQADRDGLMAKMVAATESFDTTAKETEKLTREGQVFLRDAQILVGQLKGSAGKVDPILTNLNSASADAARASKDVTKLTAALNNPRTLADLKATLANARQLTARWEAVGGDVQKLSGDPRFLDGIRSVSVGLGKFFEELYPAATDSARQRQTRANGNRAVDRLPPCPIPAPARRGATDSGRAAGAVAGGTPADGTQIRLWTGFPQAACAAAVRSARKVRCSQSWVNGEPAATVMLTAPVAVCSTSKCSASANQTSKRSAPIRLRNAATMAAASVGRPAPPADSAGSCRSGTASSGARSISRRACRPWPTARACSALETRRRRECVLLFASIRRRLPATVGARV
jgi:hypothetical protein